MLCALLGGIILASNVSGHWLVIVCGAELELYDPKLLEKPRLVVLNKTDLLLVMEDGASKLQALTEELHRHEPHLAVFVCIAVAVAPHRMGVFGWFRANNICVLHSPWLPTTRPAHPPCKTWCSTCVK